MRGSLVTSGLPANRGSWKVSGTIIGGNGRPYPMARRPHDPGPYLGSCVAGLERLDQPVGDSGGGARRRIFPRGNEDHGQLIACMLADRTTGRETVNARHVVIEDG